MAASILTWLRGGRESAKVTFPNQGNAVAEVSGSRMLLNIIGQDVELWCLDGECRLDFSDGSGYKTSANSLRIFKPATSEVEAEAEILMGLYAEIWGWNVRCGGCMLKVVPMPTPTPTTKSTVYVIPTEKPTQTPLFIKNTSPTINISAPANGASFEEGTTITFTAAAYDEEDKDLGSKVVWTEGGTQLGVGASFSKNNFAIGSHTITAAVTDSDGASASRSVTITVTNTASQTPTNITTPNNTAPIAYSQSIGEADSHDNIILLASDADGDQLTYIIITYPKGTITAINGNVVTYAQTFYCMYDCVDSFTFVANDGKINSNTATVSIHIDGFEVQPTFPGFKTFTPVP